MRTILALLFALALAIPAEAQIVKVRFKDEKAAKKFKKYTTVLSGETVMLGEPAPGEGIIIEVKGGQISNLSHKTNSDNGFYVLDTSDPSKVPYKMQGGKPVPLKKRSIVTVHGKYIKNLEMFMRSESIATIAREYRLRQGRVDALKADRDDHEKGSVEWFAAHNRMLGGYERLISWLEKSSFTERAEKLKKEYEKEAKRVSEEATRLRGKRAEESVVMKGTSEELARVTKDLAGDKYTFKVQESQHMRVTYLTQRLSDAQVEELLVFGEKVIEGFRNQFVDPYVSETFAERIPDGMFQEFYFGPDDAKFHEEFVVSYYGLSWGDAENKARRLESTGNRFNRTLEPRLLDTWRLPEREDLEGIFAHTLGHSLADYHFNSGPIGMEQAWMEEGLGYYISFEFLGRNSVSCREFRETIYVDDEKKNRSRKAEMGYRDILIAAALADGPRIDRVMLKRLFDMENGDLAKSWSFFDYISRETDITGQRWMRAACELASNRGTFIDGLRTTSEELYGVTGEDVFQVLDDRWRKYAETEQEQEW